MNWRGAMRLALPLIYVASCLCCQVFSGLWLPFREFQAVLLSFDWMLLVCLGIWCGTFIFLKFSHKDWPLLGLLLLALSAYAITYANSSRVMNVAVLLAGVALGKGTQFVLQSANISKIVNQCRPITSDTATFWCGIS